MGNSPSVFLYAIFPFFLIFCLRGAIVGNYILGKEPLVFCLELLILYGENRCLRKEVMK